MSHELHSTIHTLLEKLNNEQDLEVAKGIALKYIIETKIKDIDKRRMAMIIQYQTPTIDKFYKYLYNSMLKYEGLGTIGRKDNGNVQHLGVTRLKSGVG